GLIAMASSLDTVGPITKNVEDAAIVLNSIAGYDPMDATSSKENVLDYSLQLFDLPKGLKVGLPKEYFDEGLDTVVGDRIKKTIEVFKKLGIEVVEISLPHVGYSLAAYYVIMPSEASSNLARFDGIRYGKTRDHFGDEVKRRIILGTFALSSGYFDQYYNKARQVRKIIKDEVDEALQKVDAIIGPTAPTTAWKIGEKVDDPLKMYLSDVYTVTANLIGSPAISIPVGESNGLPVGLQILGKDFDEKTILQIANAVEKELNLSFKPDF
ncbi:MAG TPA: amidase, partial [Patescibacteria group bacterium]